MQSIEQLYHQARKTYVTRLSLFIILPITATTYLIPYLFISDQDSGSYIFSTFLISLAFGILLIFIISILFFSKSKVMKYYIPMHDKFPETDKSLLLLLSLYLIQNKRMYSLEKAHFYNPQLKFASKAFGIKYNKTTDEKDVGEILQFAKNINI